MKTRWKLLIVAVILGVLAGGIVTVRRIRVRRRSKPLRSITLQGAVIRQDADPKKQLPIADAEVSAAGGLAVADSKSDASGSRSTLSVRR